MSRASTPADQDKEEVSNMRTIISIAVVLGALATALQAQTPAPVVVQSAAPAAAPVVQAAPPQAGAPSQATLQLLQALKAANEETLKKQEATLLQLEELQKAADQLKIYSKRG